MTITRAAFDEMVRRLNANRKRGLPPCDHDECPPSHCKRTSADVRAVDNEGKLHREIMQFCRSKGWLFFRSSMAHRTRRQIGEPDFCIVADGGRVFFVEVKRPGQKPTPDQAATIAWLKKLGASAHVVHSMQEFNEAIQPAPQDPFPGEHLDGGCP